MPVQGQESDSSDIGARQFATTHWSIILSAIGEASPESETALARLCQTYWYPLYAYVRRRGFTPETAQDLVQGFFAAFLEKRYLDRANRERGRFRTFLLTSLDNFLLNELDRAAAQKRGGGHAIVSWDDQTAEERYQNEPVENVTPEMLFEKRWAATLLENTLQKLRQEFTLSSRAELFDLLEPHLWGDASSVPYAQLATQLNLTVVAIKSTVHRLRQRCRELLRIEIAHTVASIAEVDDEIRHLIQILSR